MDSRNDCFPMSRLALACLLAWSTHDALAGNCNAADGVTLASCINTAAKGDTVTTTSGNISGTIDWGVLREGVTLVVGGNTALDSIATHNAFQMNGSNIRAVGDTVFNVSMMLIDGTNTFSAVAGRTLTINPGAPAFSGELVFGSATDTGTVRVGYQGNLLLGPLSIRVAGGTLEEIFNSNPFQLTGLAQEVRVDAGATLKFDFGIDVYKIKNLQGAGTVIGASLFEISSGNFSGQIIGGSLNKVGTGTLTLSGTNTYSGATEIQAGKLTVNGSLASSRVTVHSGASLGGNGTVRSVTIAAGGMLAPGNSIGTLTVAGDLNFNAGAIYHVEADYAGNSDKVAVTGSATLGGATVQVTAAPGDYAANTMYNILHAAGEFNRTRFAGVTADLAYLTPTLSYSTDDQDVFLTLTRKLVPPVTPPGTDPVTPPSRPIRFADLVSGRNPVATANAVDSLPVSHEVYRHALTLPNGTPQSFFSALSGESHASATSALQGLSGQARSVPLAQLRANLGAGLRPGAPTAAAGISDAAPATAALPTSNAQPAWAQLVGNWQRLGATNDTSAVRLHTGGVFAGADAAIGSGWRLGGALGYTDSNVRTDGVDAKTDVSSYSAIVYGGKAFEAGPGKLNLMLGAAYTWHDLSTQRRIAVGGLDQTLRADYGASTTQVFTELGWALPAGSTLTLEPYAGLAWAGQRSRGFQETGGSAALSGSGQTNNTTTTTLGVRARQALTLGTFQGTLTGGAGWRRAFGDLRPTSTLAFDAGDAFTIAGAPIARNAALLEAGLDAAVGRNATIGLSYAGQFGSGNQDHSATLAWRWAF